MLKAQSLENDLYPFNYIGKTSADNIFNDYYPHLTSSNYTFSCISLKKTHPFHIKKC